MPDKSREFGDRFAVWCALFAAPFALACSSGHDVPGMASGNTLSSGGRDGQSTAIACTDGETRKCTKTLARHGSVLSCYDGTETCSGSEWSQCEAGTVNLMSLPLGGLRGFLSLSQAPSPCSDSDLNPCDPTCQIYDGGDAATPVVAQVNSITGWWTGDRSHLPPDVQAALSKPSCETAADCQQNQHCVNVATNPSCSHDKCTAGVALDSVCDPCVQTICDQNPACCRTSGAMKCADNELQDAAGRCYYYLSTPSTWQAARTSCLSRGTDWDLVCVTSQVEEDFLAQNAASNAWLGIIRVGDGADGFECANQQPLFAAGADLSSPPWNAGEPNNTAGVENCAQIYVGGAWNDLVCGLSLPAWCAGPARGGGIDWSASCVGAIASVCGVTCNNGGTSQSAACQGWKPGQSSPVDSFDLSIDVPCNGQVPVCNHGTLAAPAGAVVHVLSAALTQIGGLAPDLSAELGQCDVPTIEPGACVMVSGCASLLTQQNAALWVEAPAGSESRTDDNWSYSVAGTGCVLPHCSNSTEACVTSYTYTEDYLGTCAKSDALPQWSYLQFSAATPGDSSINFQVVTAASIDELATAQPISLVTASAATGITDCLLSGPAPKCPVDLYAAMLPSGSAQNQYLRLIITLNPSSDGTQSPALDFWRISFACPDAT